MPPRTNLNLNVDLHHGVVPISKAASSLAALMKRTNTTGQPVVVTQKGYPTGVMLSIELFSALKDMADTADEPLALPAPTTSEGDEDELPEESAPSDE